MRRSEPSGIDDTRVARAVGILTPTTPDLAAVADLIAGAGLGRSGGPKAIAGPEVPDTETVTAAARRVPAAANSVGELAEDEISPADRVAGYIPQHNTTTRSTAPIIARSVSAEPRRRLARERRPPCTRAQT